MAKRPILHFGDKDTSDVILRLSYADGAEYDGNPLFVHSPVLKKSEFFEAMLSERWSSDVRPIELKVRVRHDADLYFKCIRFMYLSDTEKRRWLSNVKEAMGVLDIASEFLLKDCMEVCMQYLEAVRLTAEERLQLQALISALELTPSPDLAAKLGIPERTADSQDAARRSISEWMLGISDGARCSEVGKNLGTLMSLICAEPRVRDIVPKLILADFEDDASFTESIAAAVCVGLRRNLEAIATELDKTDSFRAGIVPAEIQNPAVASLWLLEYLERLQMLELAVKLFAEDQLGLIRSLRRHLEGYNPFEETLFAILIRLSRGLGGGEAICPRTVRLSFLATWCPLIEELYYGCKNYSGSSLTNMHEELVKELMGAAETLPLVDRAQIVNIWAGSFVKFSGTLNCEVSKAIGVCCDQVRTDFESSLLHKQLRQAFLKLEESSLHQKEEKPESGRAADSATL